MIEGKTLTVGATPPGNLKLELQTTGPEVILMIPLCPFTALVGLGTVIAPTVQILPCQRSKEPVLIVLSV